ncbi:Alpha/Beta hydrolase protein [Mycena olivaceomarginata]|nr:Alpha/Beta hydrolase protein [Mycena olivaceomarginata]
MVSLKLMACLLVATPFTTTSDAQDFSLKPFKIDLAENIPRLKSLVTNTRLPDPDASPEKGIELDVFRELQGDWLTNFDWKAQQAELNQPAHFTALIEGSFHGFLPVIHPLTQSSMSASGKNVSFNVVVPSLPGFVFSSAPPANWSTDDTSTYAAHGTDWGSAVAYSLYSSFNTTVRAAHFVYIPFVSPSAAEMAANNITLSDIQKIAEQRVIEFNTVTHPRDEF